MFSETLMTDYHKDQLTCHRVTLVQNMIAMEVINALHVRKVLTAREADQICNASGLYAQNEALLDCLIRKPDSAFEEFRNALVETQQGHVARLLRKRR